MRKYCIDEVLVLIVSLATQYAKVVQYNCSRYLYQEFLMNCREAQEERKPFHYAWLLLLIVLVACQLLEDIQFPLHKEELPKVGDFKWVEVPNLVWEIKWVTPCGIKWGSCGAQHSERYGTKSCHATTPISSCTTSMGLRWAEDQRTSCAHCCQWV